MNSYFAQGAFAKPQAKTMGFQRPEDMGMEIVWGLWEVPDADNDEGVDDEPEAT